MTSEATDRLDIVKTVAASCDVPHDGEVMGSPQHHVRSVFA